VSLSCEGGKYELTFTRLAVSSPYGQNFNVFSDADYQTSCYSSTPSVSDGSNEYVETSCFAEGTYYVSYDSLFSFLFKLCLAHLYQIPDLK
jgi:hypothetical protein